MVVFCCCCVVFCRFFWVWVRVCCCFFNVGSWLVMVRFRVLIFFSIGVCFCCVVLADLRVLVVVVLLFFVVLSCCCKVGRACLFFVIFLLRACSCLVVFCRCWMGNCRGRVLWWRVRCLVLGWKVVNCFFRLLVFCCRCCFFCCSFFSWSS